MHREGFSSFPDKLLEAPSAEWQWETQVGAAICFLMGNAKPQEYYTAHARANLRLATTMRDRRGESTEYECTKQAVSHQVGGDSLQEKEMQDLYFRVFQQLQ